MSAAPEIVISPREDEARLPVPTDRAAVMARRAARKRIASVAFLKRFVVLAQT